MGYNEHKLKWKQNGTSFPTPFPPYINITDRKSFFYQIANQSATSFLGKISTQTSQIHITE